MSSSDDQETYLVILRGLGAQISSTETASPDTTNARKICCRKTCFTSSLRGLEELGLHVDLAELRYTATQLHKRLHPIQDAHVCEPDFPDEFQFGVLRERWNCLGDSKHGADDVVGGISQSPVEHKLERNKPTMLESVNQP